MELDEMKSTWLEMSSALEKQKKLTAQLIMKMTQERYQSTLARIRTPERMASVLCVGLALLILFRMNTYDTPFLIGCALASAILLLVMPFVSIRAILRISDLRITAGKSYKQMVGEYAEDKKALLAAQRLNFYLGFVLLVVILPVMVKIMGGKSMPVDSSVWYWYLPLGVLFFVVFARWVYGYYVKTTMEVENLLRELEG